MGIVENNNKINLNIVSILMNFMMYVGMYNMPCLGSDTKNIISYQQVSKGKKKSLGWFDLI